MLLELIDLANVPRNRVELVGACYRLWREVYEPIADQAMKKLEAESFFRSRVLTVIHRNGDPLSFSLSNALDLAMPGITELSYFRSMSPSLVMDLVESRSRLFTVEWVTVHPASRGRFQKVQQSDLIMGISVRAMMHTNCDAAVGFSRIDLGADRIGAHYGAQPIEPTKVFDIDCNVMLVRRPWFKAHKHRVVQAALDDLWQNKVNLTSLIHEAQPEVPNGSTEISH